MPIFTDLTPEQRYAVESAYHYLAAMLESAAREHGYIEADLHAIGTIAARRIAESEAPCSPATAAR